MAACFNHSHLYIANISQIFTKNSQKPGPKSIASISEGLRSMAPSIVLWVAMPMGV